MSRTWRESFVRCALEPLPGAYAFNLEGTVTAMDELIGTLLERLRPGAARLITAEGPQVPVAYRMDATQLRAHVPGIIPDSARETACAKPWRCLRVYSAPVLIV